MSRSTAGTYSAKIQADLRQLGLTEALSALPEFVVEAGQRLRDLNALAITNKGGGLWVALTKPINEAEIDATSSPLRDRASDGSVERLSTNAVPTSPIESELQLNGRKLKAYRCDCTDFTSRGVCAHLAAMLALVHLGRLPRVASGRTSGPAAVTTKRLLSSVADPELREFVQAYAAKHADFALELRVAFAQNLSIPQRFTRVIDRVLKRAAAQYSPREARRIDDALRQFEQQRRDWLALQNWLDVFELNTALVPRLAVIIEKAERLQTSLPHFISDAIGQLALVARSAPPPVLLERLESWLMEQLERGVYYRFDLDLSLHQLADALGHTPAVIGARVDEALVRFGESPNRLQARLELHYRAGEAQLAEALLLKHLQLPNLLFAALEAEVVEANFGRALRLSVAALQQNPPADIRLRLLRFIVGVAENASDTDALIKYVPELVVTTQRLTEADAIVFVFDETTRDELWTAVLEYLHASAIGENRTPAVPTDAFAVLELELLLRLHRFAEMEDRLYRLESPAAILRFLPTLTGKLPSDDFLLLAETKLHEELDRRLGKLPAQWTCQVLDAIAREDRAEVAPRIVTRLRRSYAQRHALIDALKSSGW